jgi:hypothetical protein
MIDYKALQDQYPLGGRFLLAMNAEGDVDDGNCALVESTPDERGNNPCTTIEVQFSGLVECTIDGKKVDPGFHKGMPMGEHTVCFIVQDMKDYVKSVRYVPAVPICPEGKTVMATWIAYAKFNPEVDYETKEPD